MTHARRILEAPPATASTPSVVKEGLDLGLRRHLLILQLMNWMKTLQCSLGCRLLVHCTVAEIELVRVKNPMKDDR